MEDQFLCPYCSQPRNSDLECLFTRCDFCGLRSALVDSSNGKLLIVDRRMPFLKRRCQELSEELPDVNVIVDRRIAQDPFGEHDRRLSLREAPAN